MQFLGDPSPLLVLEAQEAPGELVQGRRGGTMVRDVGKEDAQAFRRGADQKIETTAGPQAGHHLTPDTVAPLHALADDAAALGIGTAQVPEACAQDPVRIRPDPVPRGLVEIGDAIGAVQREVAVADAGQDGPEPLGCMVDLVQDRSAAARQVMLLPILGCGLRRGQVTHGSAPGRRNNRMTGVFAPCRRRVWNGDPRPIARSLT